MCIAGLLKADLLSETKRKTLAEVSNNSFILSETVDVLNTEIDALNSCSWGEEAVLVELRQTLNGKHYLQDLFHGDFYNLTLPDNGMW